MMKKRTIIYLNLTIILIISLTSCQSEEVENKYDIVVYGGTSAGISAAIQSSRMGKSVVLIEPTQKVGGLLGGLTTGGLGAYTMDSHHMQRYLDKNGYVKNEGDVEVGGFGPYPISYKAIVPKAEESINLLVPVCLSASHIAFDSIRMEPVFMILAQSAATAACLSIDEKVSVQMVPYSKLKEKMLEDKQVLNN